MAIAASLVVAIDFPEAAAKAAEVPKGLLMAGTEAAEVGD